MNTISDTVSTLNLLADPTRIRLLNLLCREVLSVAELVRITDLPQSRVSTHLGKLKQAGLLHDRKSGVSRFYSATESDFSPGFARTWEVLRDELKDAVLTSDLQRCQEVVSSRQANDAWADGVAGQMERHYSPGRTWEALARAFVGLVQLGDVLDLGSGDGAIAQLLAPRAKSITCLDRSPKLLDAARERLQDFPGMGFSLADMHEIPYESASFDQVLLFHVLAYTDRPEQVFRESMRVLRPGGTLVLVSLHEHQHLDISQSYGHINAGIRSQDLQSMLETAGFVTDFCEVTSREKKMPYFEVLSVFARKAHHSTGAA